MSRVERMQVQFMDVFIYTQEVSDFMIVVIYIMF